MRPTRIVAQNRATNPSFETGSGTVEVRRNHVTNPSVAIDMAGWTGGTQSATGGPIGRPAIELTRSAASVSVASSPNITMAAGEAYSISAEGTVPVGNDLALDLQYFNSTGGLIGTSARMVLTNGGTGSNRVIVEADTPTRWGVDNQTAPDGTAYARVRLFRDSGEDGTTHATDFIAEKSTKGGAFFSGDTVDAGDFTYAWTGTPHASPSIQTAVGMTGRVGLQPGSLAWRSVARARSGTYSARMRHVGANGLNAGATIFYPTSDSLVFPAGTHTWSMDVFVPTGSAHLRLEANGYAVGANSTLHDQWQRISVTFTLTGSTNVALRLRVAEPSTTGMEWWADNELIVFNSDLTDYFDGDTADDLVNGQHYSWDGTAHASTSTHEEEIFVTMDVEPSLAAPCPSARVTVYGLLPGDHVATVWRTSGGERVPVRGARAIPVIDSFYVEDFEAPLRRDVTYELEVLSGPDSGVQGANGTVVVPADRGYIQDPLNPTSAVPVHGERPRDGEAYFRADTFSSLSYRAGGSRFQIMGDPRPVSIGGSRRAPEDIPIAMSTRSSDETNRMRDLIQGAVHLVIRPLPEWGSFFPGSATYLADAVDEEPVDVAWGGSLTRWVTSGTVVRPSSARIVVPLWTYQDVEQLFATQDQKLTAASGLTYLEDQKNPANV